MGLQLPAFCDQLPWKWASVTSGVLMLFFSTSYFIESLVMSIVYSSVHNDEHGASIKSTGEVYVGFLKILAYEYGATLQITFSLMLIYGSLTEKSAFTFCWLIVQIAIMINAFLYIRHIIWEDFIFLGILGLGMLTVLKFYSDLPKTNVF